MHIKDTHTHTHAELGLLGYHFESKVEIMLTNSCAMRCVHFCPYIHAQVCFVFFIGQLLRYVFYSTHISAHMLFSGSSDL